MKHMKKNRKKGFTLVEIVVVLVIVAILAAAGIPSIYGYIDEARRTANLGIARSVYVAAAAAAIQYEDEEDADGTPDTVIDSIEEKVNDLLSDTFSYVAVADMDADREYSYTLDDREVTAFAIVLGNWVYTMTNGEFVITEA